MSVSAIAEYGGDERRKLDTESCKGTSNVDILHSMYYVLERYADVVCGTFSTTNDGTKLIG